MWNALDTTVVTSENINIFKNRLDDSWRDIRVKYEYDYKEIESD